MIPRNLNAFHSAYAGGIAEGCNNLLGIFMSRQNRCEACEGWGFDKEAGAPLKVCEPCKGTGKTPKKAGNGR